MRLILKNKEDKDLELQYIVKRLCERQISYDKEKGQVVKQLQSIYKEKYRHKYSRITTIILNSLKNNKNKEEALMTLAQNLRGLEKIIEESKEVEDIKLELEKFYDHINLECIRLQDSGDTISRLENASRALDKKHRELEENLNKQQTQYITILGVFASIVLTFVGGLVFSTSVLSNIHKADIYLLVFAMAFIALFFGNILYFLFSFLARIVLVERLQETHFSKFIYWFDAILILLIFIGLFGSTFKYTF